jgi:hypothetical protein
MSIDQFQEDKLLDVLPLLSERTDVLYWSAQYKPDAHLACKYMKYIFSQLGFPNYLSDDDDIV